MRSFNLARMAKTLFFMFALTSCSHSNSDLKKAEDFMQAHPDSSLLVLERVDTTKFSSKDKAKYSLLLSQALFRTGEDVLSDSIIKPALLYYKDHGSDYDKMLTHYYYGEILRNTSTIQDALIELQKAAEIGNRIGEKFYMGRILTSISMLNCIDYNGKDALTAAEQAKSVYEDIDDKNGIYYSEVNIAAAYGCINQYSKAEKMFIRLLNDTSHVAQSYRPNVLIDYGTLLFKMDRFDESFNILDNVYKNHPEMMPTFVLTLLSDIYLMKDNPEAAKQIIANAEAKTFDDKVFIYSILSNYYKKKGQYQVALQYSDSCAFYNSKDMSRILENNVVKYQRDQRQLDYNEASSQSSIRLYVIISLSLAIVLLLYFGYSMYRIHKEKQKILELKASEQALLFTQESSILRDNVERFKSRIIDQDSYISALRGAYQQLGKICFSYFQSPEDIKPLVLVKIVHNFANKLSSPKTVKTLQQMLDSLFPGIFKALQEDFNLTERDYKILTFTLSGFSYSTTAYIMNEKPGTLAVQRSRLRARILKAETPNRELYQYAFSGEKATFSDAAEAVGKVVADQPADEGHDGERPEE